MPKRMTDGYINNKHTLEQKDKQKNDLLLFPKPCNAYSTGVRVSNQE